MTDTLDATNTNGNGTVAPRVEVRHEPLTYRRDQPFSYFRDLATVNDNMAARDRLTRHAQEMRVTPGATTQGDGGYFVAPLWLNKMFATAPRPGRVLSALMPNFPLPAHVAHSISTPRVTTGTITNGTVDNAPVPTQDLVDAGASSTVALISGYADWPLQALEQSPVGGALDAVVYQELSEAYDYALEQQLLYGTGTTSTTSNTGQLQGILGVTGINKVTFNNGTPTLSLMYASIGQVAAQVGDQRRRPPECWLMTTSRWAWMTSSEDNSLRPITPPDTSAPPSLLSDGPGTAPSAIGALLGRWPVFLDDAVPTTFNAASVTPGGGTQDVVIACRPSDMMFFESAPSFMTAREPLSGTMGVRFIYRASAAAFTSRYPTGISVLVGTGMAVQSGF
ncbi:MAG TPA: phage major capsid protein [Acidimicrobiales bacterium]|nr:phage major capsid protein [Acidimicrobiales bacterium]